MTREALHLLSPLELVWNWTTSLELSRRLRRSTLFCSSKASDPDCIIPVVGLKNSEAELSYILPNIFNMSFQYVFEGILLSTLLECLICRPLFKNVVMRYVANKCHPASSLYFASKIFERIIHRF